MGTVNISNPKLAPISMETRLKMARLEAKLNSDQMRDHKRPLGLLDPPKFGSKAMSGDLTLPTPTRHMLITADLT